MSKKILILSHEFPPVIGGAGMVAYDVALALSNYKEDDIDITVLTNRVKGRDVNTYNFSIIQVRTIPKVRSYLYWKAIKKINIEDFDRVIINDIGAAMIAAFFFDDETKKKCIIYLHGSEPEQIFLKKSTLNKLTNFKNKYINLVNKSYKIVAVSNFMKRKFIKYTKMNKYEDKIQVIYNGLDFKDFYYSPIDLYERHNIPRDKHLILSASRIVKGKGYDEKYDIFKSLVKGNYNYHWIIVGDGVYKEELEKRFKKDHICNFVTFVGNIERKMMREYYSSADIFWLLSNFEESLGLVYIEAIACGCPVIGRNHSGVLEVISDNKTGFLVDSNEQCLDILKQKGYRKLDIERETAIIDKFNIEFTIRDLVKLL